MARVSLWDMWPHHKTGVRPSVNSAPTDLSLISESPRTHAEDRSNQPTCRFSNRSYKKPSPRQNYMNKGPTGDAFLPVGDLNGAFSLLCVRSPWRAADSRLWAHTQHPGKTLPRR